MTPKGQLSVLLCVWWGRRQKKTPVLKKHGYSETLELLFHWQKEKMLPLIDPRAWCRFSVLSVHTSVCNFMFLVCAEVMEPFLSSFLFLDVYINSDINFMFSRKWNAKVQLRWNQYILLGLVLKLGDLGWFRRKFQKAVVFEEKTHGQSLEVWITVEI